MLILVLPAHAADDPADEVVVTATRDAQRLGSTIQHTSVITEREIRASQAVDLPTLLRREAGLEFTQNGGIGRVGGLFIRGANPNQALILVDGVRINAATTGGTQIDQLLLDEIERIEIVRGPGSALYGSDAIGGVVQVFTKRGRGAPAPNAAIGFGNEGTQRYGLGYGGNAGPWQFNVSGSYFRTDGFSSLRHQRLADGQSRQRRVQESVGLGDGDVPLQRTASRRLQRVHDAGTVGFRQCVCGVAR